MGETDTSENVFYNLYLIRFASPDYIIDFFHHINGIKRFIGQNDGTIPSKRGNLGQMNRVVRLCKPSSPNYCVVRLEIS